MSTTNLIDSLLRDAIGFDYLTQFGLNTASAFKYPPHNIMKMGDDVYNLVLAVAGFAESELEVSMEGNELTIKGEKQDVKAPEYVQMLYQGLAMRNFERTWKLEDGIQVSGVSLKDGLLTVSLKRVSPEGKKKMFTIVS